MSLPTPGDVHIDGPMTDFSLLFMQDDKEFVADRNAPIIKSEHQSNTYFVYTKDYWFRSSMAPRGPGAAAVVGGYGITTGSFYCTNYAESKDIADEVRANADQALNPDKTATLFISRQERIYREKAFAAAALATGVWTTDVTGVANGLGAGEVLQWNDAASTPIEDILSYQDTIKLLTGLKPNVFTMGRQAWTQLVRHPDILALISGGANAASPSLVNRELVAKAFELDEVIVMEAVENTAAEGATWAGAYIAGKSGLLTYRTKNASPTVEDATAIATFCWTGDGRTPLGTKVKQFRMEHLSSDYKQIDSAFVHKIIAPDLGAFFATLVA